MVPQGMITVSDVRCDAGGVWAARPGRGAWGTGALSRRAHGRAAAPLGVSLGHALDQCERGVLDRSGGRAGQPEAAGSPRADGPGDRLSGGYTTFSTMAWEGMQLARGGSLRQSVLYLGGTILPGVLAAALGLWLGVGL